MVGEDLLYTAKKKRPANYFYAEWIPTGMKQSDYSRLPVGQPVQIKHPVTGMFVEPIQFISHNENGSIRIKSLDEVGVAREYFPFEYRAMKLIILKRIRKEHFDMLPADRRISVFPYATWMEYYEIRTEIDNSDDRMLVNKSQHILINSFLTDLEIFLKCGQPDWLDSGVRDARSVLVSSMLEEEIFKEYPSLKDVKHPKPEYLLREPFYGIKMSGVVELFDILENYMGYMPLDNNLYAPAEFAGLVQKYKIERIPSVRVRNIEFFIDGSHSTRRKNIEN